MKNFLAIYLGAPDQMNKWDDLPEAEQQDRLQKGMAAWGGWMEQYHDIIVTTGGPLGKTKRIDPDGVSDIRNNITGYVIVKAESHEAAAKLFEGHPSFSIFPGDGVEVMECMPIPTP